MTRRPTRLAGLAVAAAALLPAFAFAHSGGDAGAHHGFLDGLAHPFTGLDHLAAMLAVGFWSATTAQRAWLAPLAFAGMLLVGALLGLAGLALPGVEPMIGASLLVIGLLAAAQARLPAFASAAIVGGFALFHGAAHGTELAGHGAFAALAGMLIATSALHGAGIALGLAARVRSAWWSRIAGSSVALFGAALLLAR